MLKTIVRSSAVFALIVPAFSYAKQASHTDLDSFLFYNDPPSYERLDSIMKTLVQDFDSICGDTFCEGDYSNLTSLSFSCSANAETLQIRACVWSFAGSNHVLDETTGEVKIDKRVFACEIPMNTGIETFFSTLESQRCPDGLRCPMLEVPLPGSSQSIFDWLANDCL